MSSPRAIPALLAHVHRGRMPTVTADPTRNDNHAPRPRPALDEVVFDVPLEAIKMPLLVVGHADDTCVRSPAKLMKGIAERAASARKQVVAVTGGPGSTGGGLAACEGKAPHGFIEQEAEVAAGIARFIRGGRY